MLPSVSIAMTTYNGEQFIRQQLDSLLLQIYLPREIVICDEQSTDRTIAICEDFSRSCEVPIRIFVNSIRLQYRANFMKSANYCSGDLIAFCDQDDIWNPHKLEIIAKRFAAAPSLKMVSHNANLIDSSGALLGNTLVPSDIKDAVYAIGRIVPGDQPLGFTQVFRQDLLKYSDARLGTIDPLKASEPLAHDQWIHILATVTGERAYISDVLADYRQHGGNQYGAPKQVKRSIWEKIEVQLFEHADYKLLQRVNHALSVSLESVGLSFGAELFSKLANAYLLRSRVFLNKDFFDRLRAWIVMWQAGLYSNGSHISFVKGALLRDLFLGVILHASKNKSFFQHLKNWDIALEVNSEI